MIRTLQRAHDTVFLFFCLNNSSCMLWNILFKIQFGFNLFYSATKVLGRVELKTIDLRKLDGFDLEVCIVRHW